MTATLLLVLIAMLLAVCLALYLVYRETECDLPPRHIPHAHTTAHL